MIKISEIKKTKNNATAKLFGEININNDSSELFFETNIENYDYLCSDLSDAFVLATLTYAMLNNYNIYISNPISEEFFKGLTEILMPALIKMNSELSVIEIIGEKTIGLNSVSKKGSATGISCGVDSFFTVLSSIEKNPTELEYLTYFNSINSGENYSKKRELFLEAIVRPKLVANEFKLEFIPIFSNVNLFMKDFAFDQIHTFSHLSHALSVQNVISNYNYSTAFPESYFNLDFTDSANYDFLTQKAIITKTFKMVSYGGNSNRMEKTDYIASNDIVQQYLDVCLKPNKKYGMINCSKCSKCIRTIVSLDVCGKLGEFEQVFNLDIYRKNKSGFWGDILYRRVIGKSELAREILSYAKDVEYKIPILSYFYFVKIGVVNQVRKIRRII